MDRIEDALTFPQMRTILSEDRASMDRARRDLEVAQRDYSYATRREHFASDEMHEVAQRDFAPPLREAERVAARVADAAEQNARRIRHQATITVMALDPAETARAAARLPLAQQEVGNLPLPTLADRVRAAIAREDRPAMYLYAELTPERLEGEDPRADGPEGHAALSLRGMLSQIRDALRDTSFDGIRQQTDDALRKAEELRAPLRQRARENAVHLDSRGRPKVAFPD